MVIAELEEARRLGDRRLYEEALAKAEAVGGHPRRSRHRNMASAGTSAARQFAAEELGAQRLGGSFNRSEAEGDLSAGLDVSDSISTALGWYGSEASPRSPYRGSYHASASMDASQSLNFELSPIKRPVDYDSPSRKIVDAVPVRPKFDLSGLSDSVCTSNVSTPENSIVMDTVDTVIEKMCDIGFGIDTEELLAQDGTRGGSVETSLLDCCLNSMQLPPLLHDDESTTNLLTVGDTGSTDLRTSSPLDEGLRLCETVEGDLKRIDEKISALRELEVSTEKEEAVISFELHDAGPCGEEDSDDDSIYVPTPTVAGSIPIECTMLLYLRNFDCSPTMMTVIVPEGLREDRLIRVPYERKNFEFVVPHGVSPGEQLSVSIPRIPPLDGLSKVQIMNQLSHPLKWRQSFSDEGREQWLCDEARKECRMQHYQEMRGSNMNPTVATVYEDEVILDESYVTPSFA
jgi:hypothetical protein